jgi:hypothetical protein
VPVGGADDRARRAVGGDLVRGGLNGADGEAAVLVGGEPAAQVPLGYAGRQILHYTSQDLIGWQHHGPVALGSARVIDAALHPLPGGGYRMWFKDEEHGSHTYCADSPDLEAWGPARPALTGFEHEGPNVFRLGGRYWLIVDDWHGLRTDCSAGRCAATATRPSSPNSVPTPDQQAAEARRRRPSPTGVVARVLGD